MSLYSQNMIINPSAATGTNNWAQEGSGTFDTVAGGTEGDNCFYLNPSGAAIAMSQMFTGLMQPPDIKVGVDYLPENEQEENKIKAFVEVIINYADGTYDEITLPLRRDVL